MYGNLANPSTKTNPILVPYDITEEELDAQVASFLNISQIKEQSSSIEIIGFRHNNGEIKRPQFSKPNEESVGEIEVSEILTSGKKVSFVYSVYFKATNEKTWMNTTLNYYVKTNQQEPSSDLLNKSVINNIGDSNFDNSNSKREPKKEIQTKKGNKLAPIVENNNKDFVNYDFSEVYMYLPSDESYILVDKDTVVPDDDYMILYYYNAKQTFKLPTDPLSFGERNKSSLVGEYPLIANEDESNNKIFILDTKETDLGKLGWQLQASSEGMFNESGTRLAADLMFKNLDNDKTITISNESTPIYQSLDLYKKDITLVDQKSKEGLFVKVGKDSHLGEYTGEIKYTIGLCP